MHFWKKHKYSQKNVFFLNAINATTNALSKETWGLEKRFFYKCNHCEYACTFEDILDLLWLKKSNVAFGGFHNLHLNTVNWSHVSVQITCVFQGFVTTVALHWTTFVGHMHFQIPLCVKDSRAIFTFEWLLPNTLCHMTGCTIVWYLLSTVFAANFSVRIHVRLKLPPSFARFVTLLTGYHTIIMLVLHVHPEMFFRGSFKTAYNTRRHGDCRFVLLAMMLCVSNVIIFPYQKENILGRKWYVLNLVCSESGTPKPRWLWDTRR